jgi:dTMP kinase
MIDAYLASASVKCDAHALHLLFSANRWETAAVIRSHLSAGTHVVVDRYSASGMAYSVANGLDLGWCESTERGLPVPDLVMYLHVTPETAEKRDGFGSERYEKREFQERVATAYDAVSFHIPKWHKIDGNDTLEVVASHVNNAVDACLFPPPTSPSIPSSPLPSHRLPLSAVTA